MKNHLADATSPYLVQHADNPVDWYPWGEQAFALARERNVPIFLSIGYSACHWCHVMAHESFEDEATARILNEHYVSIKVDREERPDIDALYMQAVQAMTGHGGWPLNMFIDHDGKPFYGGSYFPKKERYGMPSFQSLLQALKQTWDHDPAEIERVTQEVTNHLLRRPVVTALSDEALLERATEQFVASFDTENGGFQGAPKFPTPHNLRFMLHHPDRRMQEHALFTLQRMAQSGLFDQVEGGFYRYATDEKWLIPHFEKMLADNALLIEVYLEAFEKSGEERFKSIAVRTLNFLEDSMRDPKGAYYAALDADSDGEEGAYYVFTRQELEPLGEAFLRDHAVTQQGNFEGKNHLVAADFPPGTYDEAYRRLKEMRRARFTLHRDEKVLLSLNAMMISAFVKAAKLVDISYLQKALEVLSFIEQHLIDEQGLHTAITAGKISPQATLDDYAYLARAYMDLYHHTADETYNKKAQSLVEEVKTRYQDPKGGFYLQQAGELFIQPKDRLDAAQPSGNSIMLELLKTLKEEGQADRLVQDLQYELQHYPTMMGYALYALKR